MHWRQTIKRGENPNILGRHTQDSMSQLVQLSVESD